MNVEGLTREVFEKLYFEELLTETQIAQRFGTYQVKIGRLRKKWGIPALGKSGRLAKSLPPLTDLQSDLLIGSLLGDGWMSSTSQTSARFQEGHSLQQEEYLKWKAKILGPYLAGFTKTEKVDEGKVHKGITLRTSSCPQLRPFYDLFYPEGKRVFPSSLHQRLTPFSLCVWYLDDGGLASKFHPRITFGLCDLSWKRAARALRSLGLKPEVLEYPRSRELSIRFPGQTDKFFRLIAEHVPECMSYKLPAESARRDHDRKAKTLTPEKARELREGGMEISMIANVYGVGQSTVKRRLTDTGANRMGRPRKQYSLRAAQTALSNFDTKQWGSLSDQEKDRWVEDILEILRKSPFPIKQWSDEDVLKDFAKLQELQTRLEDGFIRPQSWRGTTLCSSFFPNRYRARRAGGRSAQESWHCDEALRTAIRYQLRVGDPVLPHRVLRALTMSARTPTVFRPGVAKHVYETLDCAKVWDPCAGYGGRLLGALAAGKEYIGTDVEEETVEGNRRLAQILGGKAEVICRRAEEFDPPPVDLVFTSPPYFDREKYSSSRDQSYQHGKLQDWLDGFLRPVIGKAFRCSPQLAINIADLKSHGKVTPLVSATVEIAQSEGFRLSDTWKMPLSSLNRRKDEAWEPVLVFLR